jgi:Flp pilus assembly pilin Flp
MRAYDLKDEHTRFQEDRPTALSRLRKEEGQTTAEYALMLSVIVLALVSVAYTLIPAFRKGVTTLAADVEKVLGDGGRNAGAGPGWNDAGEAVGWNGSHEVNDAAMSSS